MKKENMSESDYPKRSIYRVPEGFFDEEIGRVTALAMSRDTGVTATKAASPLRRILLWSAGLTAAAAMLAVLIVPASLDTGESAGMLEATAETMTFSDEEVNMARPELIAENDIFLSLY